MMFTSVIFLFYSFLIFSTLSFSIVLPNLIYASAYQVSIVSLAKHGRHIGIIPCQRRPGATSLVSDQ